MVGVVGVARTLEGLSKQARLEGLKAEAGVRYGARGVRCLTAAARSLLHAAARLRAALDCRVRPTLRQGLTLVHLSVHTKQHLLWDELGGVSIRFNDKTVK